jgi:peptidoglycan L-alanyl-D-glutamate endopeptidase CwlK
MSDRLQRIRGHKIHPKLLALAEKLVVEAPQYWAISGVRTHAEQQALYAKGRTTPGKIVTNARPGYSMHNFGLAIDFCFDKDMQREGLQPGWDVASYAALGAECKKLGLEWGGLWKFVDAPHVQLPGLKLSLLRNAYAKGGMAAAWALV